MKRSTHDFRRALALLALATAVACSGGDAGGPVEIGDPVPGGTAIVAVSSDFQTFNPVTNTALITGEVINFMLFTPLVQFDENLEPVPALAQSWELDDEGVTFTLRDDVLWHDGQPVTADDVLFTFELARAPESASLLESAYLTMIDSARVIDPRTVRFDFLAPHSQPMQAFWWAPLPRHLLANVPPAQLVQAPFNRQPVGSGPFRFVSWNAGEQVVLEANEAYPEGLGGRPLVDRVVFRVVPESTTRLTEILTGSIDVDYILLPEEAQQIEAQNRARLVSYPGREFLYVGWNNEREPFTDARVRRALAMGIDRQALIDAMMFGYAQPAEGMIPPWSPVHPEIDPLPHDPSAARALLQEAGWTPGADGVMVRDGRRLAFTLLTSEDRLRQDLGVVIQSQLRQIGAAVEVRSIEFQTLLQQHRSRDYDAVLSSWVLDSFRVDPNPLFSCEEARRSGSANRAGYCNPDADRLALAGLMEADDARAREIWGEFSRILQRDQPITFLSWPDQLAAIGERIQGVEMDVRGKLLTAQRWWIPESRQ